MEQNDGSSSAPPTHIPLEIDPDEHPGSIQSPKILRIANIALTRAVAFDLDGNWYRWQFFYEHIACAVRLGILPGIVLEKARAALIAYQDREGPFSQFVTEQVNAYQDGGRMAGVRVDDIRYAAEVLMREKGKRVHVFPRELSNAAHELGMHRAIISGSMIEAVEAFAKANGIHIFLGTEHPHENGVYTGGQQKEWCMEKGNALRKLAAEHALDLFESVAIGDSMTDAEMFRIVKYPICFNPNSTLLAHARTNGWPVVIEKKDVRLILRPDHGGKLQEADLASILPADLAEALAPKVAA